jgi:hypothetical protein
VSQNINDYGRFVVIKTKCYRGGKESIKKEKIIYMLSEASRLKIGQISLVFS